MKGVFGNWGTCTGLARNGMGQDIIQDKREDNGMWGRDTVGKHIQFFLWSGGSKSLLLYEFIESVSQWVKDDVFLLLLGLGWTHPNKIVIVNFSILWLPLKHALLIECLLLLYLISEVDNRQQQQHWNKYTECHCHTASRRNGSQHQGWHLHRRWRARRIRSWRSKYRLYTTAEDVVINQKRLRRS